MSVSYVFIVRAPESQTVTSEILRRAHLNRVGAHFKEYTLTHSFEYDNDQVFPSPACAFHSLTLRIPNCGKAWMLDTTASWWGHQQSEISKEYLRQVYLWLIDLGFEEIILLTDSVVDYYPESIDHILTGLTEEEKNIHIHLLKL